MTCLIVLILFDCLWNVILLVSKGSHLRAYIIASINSIFLGPLIYGPMVRDVLGKFGTCVFLLVGATPVCAIPPLFILAPSKLRPWSLCIMFDKTSNLICNGKRSNWFSVWILEFCSWTMILTLVPRETLPVFFIPTLEGVTGLGFPFFCWVLTMRVLLLLHDG